MKNAEDSTPSLPYVSKDNVTDSVISVGDYLKDFELNTTWWFTNLVSGLKSDIVRFVQF